MEPIKFEGCNAVFGETQPEYIPLPAERRGDRNLGEILTCWKMTPEELKQIQETGQIWLSVLTFNKPLQPVLLSATKPEIYKPNYEFE